MTTRENWGSGQAYEMWVGRWSRPAGRIFLDWLAVPPRARWADVGCGTGALTQEILARCAPSQVEGVDKSAGYVEHAAAHVDDPRASFSQGDAQSLPWDGESFDVAVSGLVLNFVPDPAAMAAEMRRVTREGGVVAAYVWDYSGGMQMMRRFWDVAIGLAPGDSKLDQAERFPICEPQALQRLFADAGLREVRTQALDFPMVFRDFDDYWQPFLGRQGSAPTYLASLDAGHQVRIREALRESLPARADGSIELGARAWAVCGVR